MDRAGVAELGEIVDWAEAMKRGYLAPLLFVVGAVCLFVFTAAHLRDKPYASLTLIGFTNYSSGDRYAIFAISNRTRNMLFCRPVCLDIETASGWTTNRLGLSPNKWIGFSVPLDAPGICTFQVPTPTKGSHWKLHFSFAQNRWSDQVNDLLHSLGKNSSVHTFSGNFDLASDSLPP